MIEEVRKMWREHGLTQFPNNCRGREIDGVDLVLVDTYAAGCISAFIGNGGHLDEERKQYLLGCYEKLNKAVPQLEGKNKEYFSRLLTMAKLILNR